MHPEISFVDIHCHLIPEIDDGAATWSEALAMARLAAADGISTIIATPHQLGGFRHNAGDTIRASAARLQGLLDQNQVGVQVLAGADVRIEPDLLMQVRSGNVLTLADRKRHVLLELPHELYFPLEPVLDQLQTARLVGVLSHPERNLGLQRQPELIGQLVDAGCLMQVTAGSFTGSFGPECGRLAEAMLQQGFIHLVATDAHGVKSRRPRLLPAFQRIAELTDRQTATDLCCRFPEHVCAGRDVPAGRRIITRRKSGRWPRWLRAG